MRLAKFSEVKVECRELVAEGLGLCHLVSPEALPNTGFILGILPGEIGVARVLQIHNKYFHGRLLKQDEVTAAGRALGSFTADENYALETAAPARVPSPCSKFSVCGSCKLLHLPYAQTLAYKEKWLIANLKREHIIIPAVSLVASPEIYRYRNHVQVHINKKKERGFYAPYSYRVVEFGAEKCQLFDQALFDEQFPPELELSKCVRARFAEGRVAHHALYSPEDKVGRFAYTVDIDANSKMIVEIDNMAFFQVNSFILPLWISHIANLIAQAKVQTQAVTSPLRVLELFSGSGFISTMLSTKMSLESLGVDLAPKKAIAKTIFRVQGQSALQADVDTFRRDFEEKYLQIDLTRLQHAKVGDVASLRDFDADLVIMNPPRSGFLPSELAYFIDSVIARKLPFVYSSCNGATFARDARVLADRGYFISDLSLLDFFPWTAHYETLALFEYRE